MPVDTVHFPLSSSQHVSHPSTYTSSSTSDSSCPAPETTSAELPPLNDSVSLLYVKRKRTDSPSSSSLYVQLSAKRQKKVVSEFVLVTSTPCNEPAKLDREELLRRYKHDNTLSDIRSRCRREAEQARRNRKFNVISAARAGNGAVFSAALADDNDDDDDIMCNTEKMLSQKLSLNDTPQQPFVSNGSEEWVYDVYLCEGSCDGDISSIRCDVTEDFEPVDRERYVNEYDEDSNDENYWANDYPDEGESGASQSGASQSGASQSGDSDTGVVRNKRCSNQFFDDELALNRSDYLDRYLVSDTDSD